MSPVHPSSVHVVLPNDIDDPATPSGGNTYDRRVCRELATAGWTVREHAVPGGWPRPTATERAGLAGVLATVADDGLVLVDGLVASAVPEVLAAHAARLRLAILMHMPLADDRERAALAAAATVVATSGWTRRRLIDLYDLPAGAVSVAAPGVDPAPVTEPSATGSRLLCVAAITPGKGHDVLVEALALLDARVTCVLVGSPTRDPAFAERIRASVAAAGLADRVTFAGPRTGADLDAAYGAADLVVLASRAETYGMVITEALARGVPVLVTDVGGVREALGTTAAGEPPGLLVPPGDPSALAGALRAWLSDAGLRERLRRAATERRTSLATWADTAHHVATALSGVAA
jgi:glycosyltransferase involved in cell wall biosynthesis